MDKKYLVDLNKITVSIDVSSCFEVEYPTVGMEMLYTLLKYANKNLDTFNFDDISKTVFYSFLKKIKVNKDLLSEKDKYVMAANSNLKLDKGLPKTSWANVGVPKDSFLITLKELIVFYKALEGLQDAYEDIVIEHPVYRWNISYYFKNLEIIKTMLQKRLMYGLVMGH